MHAFKTQNIHKMKLYCHVGNVSPVTDSVNSSAVCTCTCVYIHVTLVHGSNT